MPMSLFEACEKGDSNRVKKIIDEKFNIAQVDEQGRTALHYCSNNETIDCARLLLKNVEIKKEILNLQDREGCSVIHLACMNGNEILVKYLCEEGANVKLFDKESRSVIHWITVCGHIHLFSILIKYKAPVHTPDIHGAFPIHYASQSCNDTTNKILKLHSDKGLAILQKFIDCKVDLDCIDGQGRTPLMWAASAGAIDELRLLYKYGADQLHLDKNSLSALHCAASGGHEACVEMLVEHCRCPLEGSDVNGWTPLFYSITNNHAGLCQLLLDLTANPNHKDKRGRTPSHCAITNGNFECLKYLINSNGNIWLKNKRGDYPIHEVINNIIIDKTQNQRSKYFAIIRYIFQLYPNKVNILNDEHRTPLHLAASLGDIELCEILIECGAKVNALIQNTAGDFITPYDLACMNQQEVCANYLLSKHGGQRGYLIANIFTRRIQKFYRQFKLQKENDILKDEEEKFNQKTRSILYKKKFSCPAIFSASASNSLLKQARLGFDNKNSSDHLKASPLKITVEDPMQDENNLQERCRQFMKSKTTTTSTSTTTNDNDDSRVDTSNKIIIQTSNSVATYNKLYDRRKIIVEELHKLRQAKANNNYIVINRSLYKILIENAFNPQNRSVDEIEKYLETLISTYDAELEAIRKRTNTSQSKQNRRTSLMF